MADHDKEREHHEAEARRRREHEQSAQPAPAAVAPTATAVVPTKPIAAEGEGSMTGVSMGLYSAGAVPKVEGEPVDYNAAAEAAAAYIVSPMPVMMSDADALIVGRSVEARYIPPPPPPSVIEQLNAMQAAPPPPEGGATTAQTPGPFVPQRPHPAPAPAPAPHVTPPHRP